MQRVQLTDPDAVVATFMRLAAIDSPSRQEGEIARVLVEELTALGYAVRDDATGPDCGNLIAIIPGDETLEPVLFTSHMDVVMPCLNVQPRIDDGVIRSGGDTVLGADAKASVAALLQVARLLSGPLESMQRPTVEMLFTWGEEAGHLGAKALDVDQLRARRGWVLDGLMPVGTIVLAAPTHYAFAARVMGRGAHAGVEPEKGISAIRVAAEAICRMAWGRLDPETTANIGTIHGGSARNAVAALVQTDGEVRSLTPGRADVIVRSIAATFEAVAAEAGAKADVDLTEVYRGYRLAEEEPVVAVASRAFAAIAGGARSPMVATGGGSDANEFNAREMRTCVLGIGAEGCHSTEELISASQLQLLVQWVLEILRQVS
jgi:tripeptide aminopeptidase